MTERISPISLRVQLCSVLTGLVAFSGMVIADAGANEPTPAPLATSRAECSPGQNSNSSACSTIDGRVSGAFFVPNRGQWSDQSVCYGMHANQWSVAFLESSIALSLRRATENRAKMQDDVLSENIDQGLGEYAQECRFDETTVTLSFPGANDVDPIGVNMTSTKVNYFVGGEGRASATNLPSYSALVYQDLYAGIDLHIRTDDTSGTLKYEFHVEPGADPALIQMQYAGLDCPLAIGDEGALHIETSLGTLVDHAPIAHQPALAGETRRDLEIAVEYEIVSKGTCGFALADVYDAALPLVIDPVVEWMTYLGGSHDDLGYGVALNSDGSAIVTGYTISTDFDGQNNEKHGNAPTIDVFACQVDSLGEMVWMTYLGGTANERGTSIAFDAGSDSAFVTGYTQSADFEGRANVYHPGGYYGYDAIVCKLNTSVGTVDWMVFLGGSDDDYGYGIEVDSDGRYVFATGHTQSSDFEWRKNNNHGSEDAFVCKTRSMDAVVEWMTYLGGTNDESGRAITVDSATGETIIAGYTYSIDFEGRNNEYHAGESSDAFVCEVGAAGDTGWMTYLGGSRLDRAEAIALDTGGDNALVGGYTQSADFEARNNDYHGEFWEDAFVCEVNRSAGDVTWMTYCGGERQDIAYSLSLNSDGDIYLAGWTSSTEFEGRNNELHGGVRSDAFACKVIASSGALDWMTYLGGTRFDYGQGISIRHESDEAFVAGYTQSDDFEGRRNEHHPGGYNDYDAFVMKIVPGPTTCLSLNVTPLISDQDAIWSITGADPESNGVVIYGFSAGETIVDGFGGYCATFDIAGVNQSRVIGFWTADEFGEATVVKHIPPGRVGLSVLTQAAQRDTCPDSCVSEVNERTIQMN